MAARYGPIVEVSVAATLCHTTIRTFPLRDQGLEMIGLAAECGATSVRMHDGGEATQCSEKRRRPRELANLVDHTAAFVQRYSHPSPDVNSPFTSSSDDLDARVFDMRIAAAVPLRLKLEQSNN